MWSNIEQGLAITAGSLATLRPFLRLITRKLGLNTRAPGGTPNDVHYPSAPRKRSKGPFSLVTLESNACGSSTVDDRGDEIKILEAQQEPSITKASKSFNFSEVTNDEAQHQAPTYRHVLENNQMSMDRDSEVGLKTIEENFPARGSVDKGTTEINAVGESRNSSRSSLDWPFQHPLSHDG